MELTLGIVSLAVAAVAALIALWQGLMAREQLRLAQNTNEDTQRALQEIRELAKENKQIAEGIRTEIDQRINRILDLRLENERRDNEMSNRMAEGMLTGLGTLITKAIDSADTTESS